MTATQYDRLYRVYEEFDTDTLREYQDFVDLFPPVDSPVALDRWQDANEELTAMKSEIADSITDGEIYAEIAARVDRDSAFTAIDLFTKYDRGVDALVLDVDETLRSAGNTDNEIPRDTLHVLGEFHEAGVPIIICTGQTLENVKGFTIQGLGNEIVHSGALSIVYESGSGVFTPGHGADTKRLLYEDLDAEIQDVFDYLRTNVLSAAPEDVRRCCHVQGNEFNVTLKPNFETGSDRAESIVDTALVYLIDLLGSAVSDDDRASSWARAYYAGADPEIRSVLEAENATSNVDSESIPEAVRSIFDRIDVAYYHADAAEISSLALTKTGGVETALSVLGIDDPFVAVFGDSKSDLRVMQAARDGGWGIAAAPEHASESVLAHVNETDGLVFDQGRSATMLRTVFVLNLLAGAIEVPPSRKANTEFGKSLFSYCRYLLD